VLRLEQELAITSQKAERLLVWKGSTTVARTVVRRNSVLWCTGWHTAMWLAKEKPIAWKIITGHVQKGEFSDQ